MEKNDSIAIVGIACRFPGADDIDEFWGVLKNAEDHVKIIPKERWDTENINIVKLDNAWKKDATLAGLIKDHDKCDNKFFGMSDLEAGWMDPQQYLALEVTYSALEDAGFTRQYLKGTNTGVYMGVMNRDLSLGLTEATAEYNNFLVTGIASSLISNRISYMFDIRGPSITVDTACSSALVAVHLGCQAIKSGDCEIAICGGVNSILTPINNIALSKAQMISKTGKSRAFSADADGYARGEGCGIVVLKSLKRAKADGDKIWGIVMSGCNQDGKASTPITAPSKQQQKSLLQNIYSHHKIARSSVQYIEAHGTGTPIGDLVEITGLAEFFSSRRKQNKKTLIGSVKTNIGHLESSAGTAGLIKVLLMMKYEKIVPSLHFAKEQGNTKIDFEQIALEVSTQLYEWKPHVDGTRISCVNSFGFGGTNCHAIIKQLVPVPTSTTNKTNMWLDFPIILSASTPQALESTARHFLKKLHAEMYDIQDLSYTTVKKREHFMHRIGFVAKTTSELITQLSNTIGDLNLNSQRETKKTQLIMLFCGVGTLWVGMCKKLLETSDIFKQIAKKIDKEILKHDTISILETLQHPPQNFMSDSFLGPIAIFTCQVALFEMWKSLGVSPNVIIGQSVGEVAAAYAAGCLKLSEAVKVIYYRSLLSSKAPSGRMVVVGKCDVNKLEEVCKSYGDKLNIAVYTSKETCVVSGNETAIENLKKNLFNNPEFPSALLTDLKVTCPYHSHYMEKPSETLAYHLHDLEGRPPGIKIISTVSGKAITGTEMGMAKYWSSNLRKPVLLFDAINLAIDNDMKNVFLEIGPKPVIPAHLKMITDAVAESIPSCNSPDDGNTFVRAVTALFMRGIHVNITQMAPSDGNLTDIPRYKFYRTGTLLLSEAVRASLKMTKSSRENHPFISAKSHSHQLSVTLSFENTPYIYEHTLDHKHIVPGALHAEIGLAVAKAFSSIPLLETSVSLNFLKPVFVDKTHILELDVYVSKGDGTFKIRKQRDVVCTGKYFTCKKEYPVVVDISRIKQQCPFYVTKETFYLTLKDLGFEYGEILRVIRNSWRSEKEYIAELLVPNDISEEMYTVNLHPCILDGVLQTLSVSWISARAIPDYKIIDNSRPIPVKLGALSVKRVPKRKMYVYGKMMKYTFHRAFINLLLLSEHGEVIAAIENYEVKNVSPEHLMSSLIDISYKTRWLPVEIDYDARQDHNTTENTMFICFSKDTYAYCQKTFTSASVSSICFDVPFTKTFQTGDTVEKLFQDNNSLTGIKYIIYFPGYDHSSESFNTEEVYQCIKASCLCLLKLIQRLIKENIDISLLVVTKNTQPHVTTDKCKYNIIGSELWGMCRSLIRERAYSNLRLLDISEDNELRTILKIIDKLEASDLWKSTPEFKFAENKIYINQIVRFNDDLVDFRNNHYNENEALELRSSTHDNLGDLFFVPKPKSKDNLKYCTLKVETALVTPTFSPLTITVAIDDPDPLKAIRADGHEIIAAEVCGQIGVDSYELHEQLIYFREVISESKSKKKKELYLSCFPCNVSNSVHVPRSCLINKNAFPLYKPGIMHESIWYFALLEVLSNDQQLGIIYDEELFFDLDLLHSILASNKHGSVFSCSIDDFRDTDVKSGKFEVLLLTKIVSTFKDCVSKMAQISSRVITYSQLVSKAEERFLRQQLKGVEICIINNDDMLSEQRLSKLVKLLREWLTKTHSNDLRIITMERKNATLINFNDRLRSDLMTNCEVIPVKTKKDDLFSKSAGYLIIGGLTGLGWEIVKLIAQRGGGCVAILSRQSPSEERQKEINKLSFEFECKIIASQADVSEVDSLTNAFESYQRECPSFPLRGIFHGAAVVEDALILYMTEVKFEKVLKPKIKGTMNLHLLTQKMKLDYFVLHSSITSVLGNTGQSNYGAGNAFMDTFAFYRRSLGLCGQTINWGALHLGILTASANVEKHLNSQGYASLQPEVVMECLLHTLCNDLPQIVYGNFKWEIILRQSPDITLSSKLKPIFKELNLPEIYTTKKDRKIFVDLGELHGLPNEKRKKKINDVLVLLAADIFAVEETLVTIETKFLQFGIDSMKAIAFINTIYEHFNCRIPVMSVLDDDANIESITTLILNQMTLPSDITRMASHFQN